MPALEDINLRKGTSEPSGMSISMKFLELLIIHEWKIYIPPAAD